MSRIPQSNSTRTKKEAKEPPNDTKDRLIETFRRLENPSDQRAAFPTAAQIEHISTSPLAPHLLLLSEHVVGHAQANHVRRQLHDLQRSNLPRSIIGEVFPNELILKAHHVSSAAFESAKEKTLNLEDECRHKEATRSHTLDELEGYKKKHKHLIELVAVATQTRVALEQVQKQIKTIKSNVSPQIIADVANTIPALISAIESPDSDVGIPKIDAFESSSNRFAPWTQLLEATSQIIGGTALPMSTSARPDITNVTNTISGIKGVLFDLSPSSIHQDGIQHDIILDSQLQGAEEYSNYPGREAIVELAKTKARIKLLQAIPEPLALRTDTLESTEARVVDLHTRTTRLLEAAQALMRETKTLVVDLPREALEEILPTSGQISALKDELGGCFEARRLDVHDPVIDQTKGFSQSVCETLGLPPNTSPDAIYDHVQNLLSRSS